MFTEQEKFHMDCDSSTIRDVRRLAPQFESHGWKKDVSTTWKWYWQDVNGEYVEYGKQVKTLISI